jgi:hypothetical protein
MKGTPTRRRWPKSLEAWLKKYEHTTSKNGNVRYYPNWLHVTDKHKLVVENINVGDINIKVTK